MYIEYYTNSIDDKEIDIKNNIDNILPYNISAVSAPLSQIRFIKKNFETLKCGCFVDYPLAYCDINRRQDLILDAIKVAHIDFINIPIPFFTIINRKYDKFREDIKNLKDLCDYNKIQLRYFLEYRIYSYDLLYKIAQVLLEFDINICFPSTGHLLDDINDNLIASAMINKKTEKINMIINGNIWNSSQANLIFKSKPYGIRLNSINSLQLFLENSKKIAD